MRLNQLSRIFLLASMLTHIAVAAENDVQRSGEFQISASMAQVVGESTAKLTRSAFAEDELLSWEIYVPENYHPEKPAGLMVYISPSSSGEIPRDWISVMDEHNLIWVAANDSGNSALVSRRAIFAMIAPTMIGRNYEIDSERVYLSGLSGGGRMASRVATDHAHLFKGAIYNCGVDFWQQDPPRRLQQIQNNHYVLVTGTFDQALKPTKKVYRQYRNAGVENTKLMVIRNMTHRNPGRYKFSEAIRYLDSRLESESDSQSDTAL